MRNILILTCCLALAPLAAAQQGARFGVGIGVGSAGAVFDSDEMIFGVPASIYLPITFSSFRIEPEVGLFRSSVSNDDADFESSVTVLQLGTGVFALRPMGPTNFYYGGRVGITRLAIDVSSGGDDDEESTNHFFVGPAVGGEYMFGDNFSLGGEAQLIFTALGNADEDDDTSRSLLYTGGVFFVRWHF